MIEGGEPEDVNSQKQRQTDTDERGSDFRK